MKIGFFGDSFCADLTNQHSLLKGYDTYIKKIKNHYDAEIVNLGVGGSSTWDCILQQFPPFVDNPPDVCIFTWTDANRLYHPRLRTLTASSVLSKSWKDITLGVLAHRKTLTAAQHYFKLLHDPEKAEIEQRAALLYFDLKWLPRINSKIIHLWCFDKKHDWENGVDIQTPLSSFSDFDAEGFDTWAANHIAGDEKNQEVFELIRSTLDSYGQSQPS